MGEHSPFGMAGGAARVHLVEDGVGRDLVVGGWVGRRHPVVVVLPPQRAHRIDGHEALDRLEFAADLVHGRDILARRDQQLRLGVIDDMAPLRRCHRQFSGTGTPICARISCKS